MDISVNHLITKTQLLVGTILITLSPAEAVTINFEDLRPGSTYCTHCDIGVPTFAPLNRIYTAGTRIELSQFFPSSLVPIPVSTNGLFRGPEGGFASVISTGDDRDRFSIGNYLKVENGSLDFEIHESTERLSLDFYSEYSGNNLFNNLFGLNINGELIKGDNLFKLDGITIGDVTISVLTPKTQTPSLVGWHTLVLDGALDQFSFGGVAFSIDNISYQDKRGSEVPEPTSMLLLGSGLLGLCGRKSKK